MYLQGGPGFEVNAPYNLGYGGKVEVFLFCVFTRLYYSQFTDSKIARFMNRVIRYDDPATRRLVTSIDVVGQTLWLDQRGPGLSMPLSPDTLP